MSSSRRLPIEELSNSVSAGTLWLAGGIGLLIATGYVVVSASISPWVGLGAIAGGIVCLGMFFSLEITMAVVAVTLPLERLGRLTEDFSSFTISLSRIVGVIALLALLIYAAIHHKKLRFGLPFWLYSGYVTMAGLGIIWALAEKDAIRDSGRVLGNLLFFFLIVNLVRNMKMAHIGILLWLVGTAGSGLYAIYSYHFGGDEDAVEESQMGSTSERFTAVVEDDSETPVLGMKVKRVYGTTSHPGVFGLNLVMTLPFFAWTFRSFNKIGKLLSIAGFLLVCYCILLSNTRAVFLLAAITLVLTIVRGIWDLKPHSLACIVLAVACMLPIVPQDVYMRTLDPSLYSADKSGSIRIRFKMLEKSVELLESHWMLGIGIGNQTIIPQMITDEPGGRITPDGVKASAHNEFVWSMVEVGLLGWLLHWSFVVLIIATSFRMAKRFRKNRDTENEYWLMVASQITLIVVVLFGVQTEVFHFSLKGWWFVAGICWALWEASNRKAATPLLEPVI